MWASQSKKTHGFSQLTMKICHQTTYKTKLWKRSLEIIVHAASQSNMKLQFQILL